MIIMSYICSSCFSHVFIQPALYLSNAFLVQSSCFVHTSFMLSTCWFLCYSHIFHMPLHTLLMSASDLPYVFLIPPSCLPNASLIPPSCYPYYLLMSSLSPSLCLSHLIRISLIPSSSLPQSFIIPHSYLPHASSHLCRGEGFSRSHHY